MAVVSGVTSQGGGPSGNMVDSQDLSVDSGTEDEELMVTMVSNADTQPSQSHRYLLMRLHVLGYI